MDKVKKKCLIESVSWQAEPQFVSVNDFFSGNDDNSSIGCNLLEHPGIKIFNEIFTDLEKHKDVEAVYIQIAELDPSEDSWPFSDTVLVIGNISKSNLHNIVSPLKPDEIGTGEEYGAPQIIMEKYKSWNIYAVWWD